MPRVNADRDGFVAEIDRRRRLARLVARGRRALGLARQPFQAEVYDATFRSDAEAVSYFYAVRNDHLPDLDAPVWLNEKIRWQFLHHPNPLMSLAADKIAVRDYLRHKGARIAPPALLATGEAPEALTRTDLPPRFVLKSNHGSGQMYKEDGSRPTPAATLARWVAAWNDFDQWRRTGELHYRDIRKRWLLEELLPVGPGSLEFQVACMNGEPMYVTVITERSGKGAGNFKQAIYDPDWKPLDVHVRGVETDTRRVSRPEMLGAMLAEARRLSEDFLHVRVDFLHFGGRLAFSELTFADFAARVPFEPVERNAEFGALMDLSAADDRLARGKRIAAGLGRRSSARPRPHDRAGVWT